MGDRDLLDLDLVGRVEISRWMAGWMDGWMDGWLRGRRVKRVDLCILDYLFIYYIYNERTNERTNIVCGKVKRNQIVRLEEKSPSIYLSSRLHRTQLVR